MVQVPGVRLENLVIERTVGGDIGEVVLFAYPGTSPVLNGVRLRGVAENAQWEGATWEILTELDLKEVETDIQVQRCLLLKIGSPCQVKCELGWLQVKPNYLSPGPQRLDIVLNSKGIPPGTRLSGSITLESTDGSRAIVVTARVITPLVTTLSSLPKEPSETEKISAEDWGYRFLGRVAIDNFIRDIEGEAALQHYSEFRDRRNRAEELIFQLTGNNAYLFYVRRKGQGQEPGEENWDLTIAIDREDAELPTLLSERGQTLGLLAVVSQTGNQGLQLRSARLLPLERGRADNLAVPFHLRLRSNYRYGIGVPQTAFTRMEAMPFPSDLVPTEDQLQAWEAFLNVEERQAQARQFCVPFVSHNYGEATRNITFKIDANSATVDGNSKNSLDLDDFWGRVKRARNSDIKILEDSSTIVKGNREGRELGTIEFLEPRTGIIKVRLDAGIFDLIAEGRYRLPNTGLLSFISFGDIVQIDRKRKALQDLKNGRSQNPYLGLFLFDASQARPLQQRVILQQQDLLLKAANENQKIAVETVLAAPDIALIQGPPGTGKTTVIAEICYQVALRGGRTLIASQANLAVDNALSRLTHNPAIRAVRKGNANSVSPEGEPFLEHQVISTWLKNTSSDCKNRLWQQRETVGIFYKLLESLERFTAYLAVEETFKHEQKRLQEHKALLEFNYQAKVKSRNLAATKQNQVKSLLAALENLFTCEPSVNWCEPEVIDLLSRLQSYTDRDKAVQSLATNVCATLNLLAEFALVPPELRALGVAGWLQSNLPSILAEAQIVLAHARNAAIVMAEAESSYHIFQEHSTLLATVEEKYRQCLAIQKSQQQEIANLQNTKSKISLVKIGFAQWSCTAKDSVYIVLKKCLQKRHFFADDLIKLPLGLQEIVTTNNILIWHQHFTQCQININQLVTQYRQRDRAKAITRNIESLISPELNKLPPKKAPSEKVVVQTTERLKIKTLAIEELQSLAEEKLQIIAKPLSFWDKFVEFILAIVAELKLSQPSPRSSALATLEAIRITARRIRHNSQNDDIDLVARANTKELVEVLINQIPDWLNQEQTKIENSIKSLQQVNEQIKLVADLQTQISAVQELVETSRNNKAQKVTRAIELLQKLTRLKLIPAKLRNLVEQCLQTPTQSLNQSSQLLNQVYEWESSINEIERLIPSINPFTILSNIKNLIRVDLATQKDAIQCTIREITDLQNQLYTIDTQLKQKQDDLMIERAWWQEYWRTIPDRLKPPVPHTGLFDLKLLRSVEAQFDAWKQELAAAEAYLSKYQNLLSDWIAKLRNPSEQDRNELRRIYLDNANVIGITCSQSASRDFSEEFKSFDVVIIDEVSKCTPPELLIPALKAKKLVLVGDHRQLPPMLDSDTLEEIAEELGSTREELSYLEESLFKSQFELANESIKRMLSIQYRMHPIIMGAINQFYENRLECGLFAADQQRAHHLSGELINEPHHLIWIRTPIEQQFQEQQDGTSFINVKEVEVITKICEQMERAWFSKIQQGQPRKEIGIITFYGRQLKLIEDRIDPQRFPSLHIRTGTVDRFQGMERQVIIVSMVRNNAQGNVGFAKKPERINVAFSRAQELLVIVGCHSLFTQQHGKVGSMYSNISNVVRLHGGFINVSDILC
ncbi:MAG: AAA family ATPase [Aphanothece sp. CMT-3BRIN-NPC111]|nr:AAA family ATPase [Aphanothece sp. CMT-3BRIN-NPC111]